jgi:lysophospholipase L1-like esterase
MMRTALLAAALLLSAAAPAPDGWVPGWTAPPIGYEPTIRDALGRPFRNETVRQELAAGVSGRRLRLRLTNELSADPLRIGAMSIVRLDAAGAPIAASLRPLSFAGAKGTLIPPGAAMLSDTLDYPVRHGERVAVSIHFPYEAAPPAHAQMVDIVAGDATARPVLASPRRARAAGVVSGMEIFGSGATRVLVTFGDSITEGAGASPGKAMSWPDQLGRLLAAAPRGKCWAIANAGISGNRLLSTGRGPAALARFDRDVLAVPGATHVVVLEGINDIGKVNDLTKDRQPSTEELIAAYRQLLSRAQARGLKVIFGTLLPYEGAAYADAAGEGRRSAVNRWLRSHATEFDGLIDFDAAMGEPGKPSAMRLSDQIGDHLHPNDQGYARMATAALPVVLRQGC